MKTSAEHVSHRAVIFRHYAEDMRKACLKTGGRVEFVACDILTETIIVCYHDVRSLCTAERSPKSYNAETLDFTIGFLCTEHLPRPSGIVILSPVGRLAHPNSDGIRVCVGEALPALLPAEFLLLHTYRILSFQKFNIASAVNADVVRYILEQPPDFFPTDRSPLFFAGLKP